ncbi:MAG TPA: hypothetical protein VFQ65_31850 [Kofleriaceae bacterium]|nr:hypothetical protein [Kofleriaceae bacterium]
MAKRWVLVATLAFGGTAAADTFGGFSSIDAPYLVNQDRLCAPLEVTNGQATGTPKCEKAAADDIAKATIKPGVVQSGAKATYAASAAGSTLTITKDGSAVVTWKTPDPIGKVVDVFASPYEDRVAVTYTTRALGKETASVIAFVIVKTTGRDPSATPPTKPPTGGTPVATTPKEDPAVVKAADAARKADKKKALAAWQAVQALDTEHSEARYRIAVLQASAKHTAEAIATLAELAKSSRGDAVEWLVEARFDPAFAAIRADATYRKAVGLDRPAQTIYERLMGFGGQWEQTGTSCDAPQIRLVVKRDRSVKLNVKSSCNGQVYDIPFKGTWRVEDADHLTLIMPTKGQAASAKDEAPCVLKKHGEEDELHCIVGKDLEFDVLPTRR